MGISPVPASIADEDHSLCSGCLVDLEENLETTYEQSGFDICSMYVEWNVTSSAAGVWEIPEDGTAFPVPFRYDLDGTFHELEVSLEVMISTPVPLGGKFTIRVYCLPYGAEPSLDATDGIVDEDAYDERITTSTTWELLTFTIKPAAAATFRGDGSVATAAPMGWLRIITSCDKAGEDLTTASIRVREVIA
jgi:hypothetical protein